MNYVESLIITSSNRLEKENNILTKEEGLLLLALQLHLTTVN